MPKPCSVCTHRQRDEIDSRLIAGEAITRIAKAFAIPESNLRRHKTHLARVLARSEQARAEDLMQHILHLRDEAKRLQAAAEQRGDVRTAIAALRELTRLAELLARIAGDVKAPQVNVLNITVDEATARRMAETFLSRRRELPANV
jgi:hypothetical protein